MSTELRVNGYKASDICYGVDDSGLPRLTLIFPMTGTGENDIYASGRTFMEAIEVARVMFDIVEENEND